MSNLIVTDGYGAIDDIAIQPGDPDCIDFDISVIEQELNFNLDTVALSFSADTVVENLLFTTQDLTTDIVTSNLEFNVEVTDYC